MNDIIYFLDRSVIIDYLIGEPGVRQKLFDDKKYPSCRISISIATLSNLYEMYPDYRKTIEKLPSEFEVVNFELTDFDESIKIRSELGNNWQIDNFWDLLFAAHVRDRRAIMVTTTGKGARFSNIKKLVDENWGSEEQVVLEFTGVTGNERGVIYKIAKTISDLGISISHVDASTKFNFDDNHNNEHELKLVLDLTDRSRRDLLRDLLHIKTRIRYAMNYTVDIDIDDSQSHSAGSVDDQIQQFVCTFMAKSSKRGARPAGESVWPRIRIEGKNRVGLLKDITCILYENGIDIISATTPLPPGEGSERFILSLNLMPEITRPSDNLFAEICEKINQIEEVKCFPWGELGL
jgi:predicted nucleic acid-binding protein/predicted amino acid-binding ACT domain protein